MRAAVLDAGRLSVEDVAEPVPGPGQLLLAPLATGICGSDLHARAMMAEAAEVVPPEQRAELLPTIVPGHEFCAEVVDAGPGTDGPPPGTRVCAIPFTEGAEGMETIGLSPSRGGALAELTVADAVRVFAVPDGVPSDLAALTEPLAVGLHAAGLADRNPAEPCVVIGCGPIGLAVVLALVAAGRGPVVATDLSPDRRAVAAAVGADHVVDPAAGSVFEALAELGFVAEPVSPLLDRHAGGRPRGLNVFECVGAPGLLATIITEAPAHTHVVVAGVCPHEDTITPVEATVRELTLEFAFAYRPADFAAALRTVQTHPVEVERLVTARVGLDDTAWAFDALGDTPPSQVKILIDPRR